MRDIQRPMPNISILISTNFAGYEDDEIAYRKERSVKTVISKADITVQDAVTMTSVAMQLVH